MRAPGVGDCLCRWAVGGKLDHPKGQEFSQYPQTGSSPFFFFLSEAPPLLLKSVPKLLKSGSWNAWKVWSLQCYVEAKFKASLPVVTCAQVLSHWWSQQYLWQMQQNNSHSLGCRPWQAWTKSKALDAQRRRCAENAISCGLRTVGTSSLVMQETRQQSAFFFLSSPVNGTRAWAGLTVTAKGQTTSNSGKARCIEGPSINKNFHNNYHVSNTF